MRHNPKRTELKSFAVKRLSREAERVAIAEAKAGNRAARDTLLRTCLQFIVKQAWRYAHQGVDVDDLVPLALALGVTPNVLLMPPVSYFGGTEVYELTPAARGTAEELWHWAQGEKDIPVLADGAVKWLGDGEFPISEFPVRSRPYLTAPLPPGAHENEAVRDVIRAVLEARHAGASAAEVRRAVEMTLSIPVLRAVPEFRDRIWGPREKKEKGKKA